MDDKPQELLSGVEIQVSPILENNDNEVQPNADEGAELMLGDRGLIESSRYGRTLGRIFYIDEKIIRILPDGVSDRLYDFPIVNGEFAPDLGVTSTEFEEGPRTSFVNFTGLRAKSSIDTFSADGKPIGIFQIVEVDERNDRATISDTTGAELVLQFNYHGIPPTAPFDVLRISPEAAEEASPEEASPEETPEEDEDIEFIGTIEIPIAQTIIELPSKDLTYPDNSQKSDLLADILSFFDPASQKNPMNLKKLRSFVEMVHLLKTDLIKSRDDGSITGEQKISFETISEILENRTVPLSRPVLTTKRVLQLDELTDVEGIEKHTDDLDIYLLYNTLENSIVYQQTYGGLQQGEPSEAALPLWYQYLGGLFQRYPLGDVYSGTDHTFQTDSEFIRSDIELIEGLSKMPLKDRKEIVSDSDIENIQFSIRRGLGSTVRKQGVSETRTVFRADKADSKYYLLFPEKAANFIGTTRTGSLFSDIMRSHDVKKSLKTLIDEIGEPTDIPDANNILLLNKSSSIISNIAWKDYLQVILQSHVVRGIGDIKTLLLDYGVINKELTLEQQDVVEERVKQVLILLRGLIRFYRADQPEVIPVFENIGGPSFKDHITSTIQSHPILQHIIDNCKQRTPGYAAIDLGLIGSLHYYAQDYALSVIAKEPIGTQRERIRAIREQFIKVLQNAQLVRSNEAAKGLPPEINPCPHVKDLSQIRRAQNDTEKIALLSKFITRYQGGREQNWITCISCNQNLICQHELLQVQQYLHPREYDVLQKQIILNFAGGTFGSKNICRNCGIPISDIDYDRNIEFDDEGRPMNGRGEVVDEDLALEEELDKKLGAPIGTEPEIEFETDEKTMIYQTVRQLSDRAGVFPDVKGFRSIVNRVNVELLRQDRKSFAEQQKKRKERGEKTGDFDVYINRLMVSFVAACYLIEIQTKIPDYTQRFATPGCRPGFDGYPLYLSADPKSPNESIGIHYIACAITGIISDKAPWVLTGWQQERSDAKRQALIVTAMTSVLKVLSIEPSNQLAMEKKRNYLKEIFGKESDTGRPSEKIPYRFLPPIETGHEAVQGSVESPVVPEAVKDGASAISLNWIRAANRLAKNTARIVPNTPFSESGCCFTSVASPGLYWSENKMQLPPLPSKVPIQFALGRQSWLFVGYETRPNTIVEAEIPFDLAYKIFARLCYKGSRIGQPHELGFDGKCDWCDTQIPIEVLFPDVNNSGKPVVGEEKLLDSFTSQGISITQESFEQILQESHRNNSFTSYRAPLPLEAGAILEKIGSIVPEPVEQWKERVASTIERLSKLRKDSARAEIADAVQDIAEAVAIVEETIKRRIGEDAFGVLTSIFNESTQNVFEFVKANFVIPIQRIITNYNTDLMRVHKQYKLSQDHAEDVVKILKAHTRISSSINHDTLGVFGLAKYKFFIDQMMVIMRMSSEIKNSRIPYGNYIMSYILRALIMGPLSSLLDPNQIPTTAADIVGLSSGKSSKSILITIRSFIQQLKKEQLSYSPDTIREKIAKEDEKEKESFISDIDKLSDDDKKLELLRKNLGMGRWAIGGTKLIYAYDADQYDKERVARMEQYTSVGVGPEGPSMPEGRTADALGIFNYGTDYTERDGGYDFVFYDKDDGE